MKYINLKCLVLKCEVRTVKREVTTGLSNITDTFYNSFSETKCFHLCHRTRHACCLVIQNMQYSVLRVIALTETNERGKEQTVQLKAIPIHTYTHSLIFFEVVRQKGRLD